MIIDLLMLWPLWTILTWLMYLQIENFYLKKKSQQLNEDIKSIEARLIRLARGRK